MSPAGSFSVFWGEISPCDHSVQIYENDIGFIDALEGFVAGGLRSGEAVVVIATPPHVSCLTVRLARQGFDLQAAIATDQLILLDAEQTLRSFMRNGWPDDTLFQQSVRETLRRARGDGRRVRAAGEMVALLWAEGHTAATVRLEHLWHQLCQQETFSLFCAYPRSGFTRNAVESIREICETHDRVLPHVH